MAFSAALKAHSKRAAQHRLKTWRSFFLCLLRRRSQYTTGTAVPLLMSFANYRKQGHNYEQSLVRTNLIACTSFEDVFAQMGDEQCLKHFRFLRADVLMIAKILCPTVVHTTSRKRYKSNPLLTSCVILSRMATPYRWSDWETIFRRYSSNLSEIFWEGLDTFLDEHVKLITGPLYAPYIVENAARWATAVFEKTQALENCIGFIDGTVIKIARPDDDGLQNVVYNGHKRCHALKFQAVLCPDGIILHAYGPVEGRRHDWTLFSRSPLDEQLSHALLHDEEQYCIYGDSGYNPREYLEVPFQGSDLNANQTQFNKSMAGALITVELVFKEVKVYWSTTDYRRKLRVLQAPSGSLYLGAMLLTNMRTCLYGNQVSKYFSCAPPSLQAYMNSRG